MITFSMNGETICHETRTKVTGADVLMKPAAPGTGIIAGGTVRSIMGLTGVKNLISKSLGSTNKVNIAYAVIEGLKAQVPRNQWTGKKGAAKVAEPAKAAESVAKVEAKPAAKAEAKPAAKAEKPAARTAKKPAVKAAAKPAAKKPAAKKAATKKAAPKKEDK
jgi:small subunit ribosomal protein S5